MTRSLAFAAIILWLVTVIGGGVLFVTGRTTPSSDSRTAILLSGAEKDYVLSEMRKMLISVQQIAEALSHEDYAGAGEAARKSSHHEVTQTPIGLMTKLPLDFKQAGMRMHAGFADFAKSAEQRDPTPSLYGKLAEQINACVGCHETYRIDIER